MLKFVSLFYQPCPIKFDSYIFDHVPYTVVVKVKHRLEQQSKIKSDKTLPWGNTFQYLESQTTSPFIAKANQKTA